jgi:hypothetical protein
MNVNACCASTKGNNSEVYARKMDEVTRDAGPTHVISGMMHSQLDLSFHGNPKLQQWQKLGEVSSAFPEPPLRTRGCQFGLAVTETASPTAVAKEILNEFVDNVVDNVCKYELHDDISNGDVTVFKRRVTLIHRDFGERVAEAELHLYHGAVPSSLLLTSNSLSLVAPLPTSSTEASLSSPRMVEATLVDISCVSGSASDVSAFFQRLRARLGDRFLGCYENASCGESETAGIAVVGTEDDGVCSETDDDDSQHLATVAEAIVSRASADTAGLADAVNMLWQLSIEHPVALRSLVCKEEILGTILSALHVPAREPTLLAGRLCERLSQFETSPIELCARARLCTAAAAACCGNPAHRPVYVVDALTKACVRMASNMAEVLCSALQTLSKEDWRAAVGAVDTAMTTCNACPDERIRSRALDELFDVRERLAASH